METTELTTAAPKQLQPWQNSLMLAEAKFMAISGKKEQTKIELGFAAMIIEGSEMLRKCDPQSIMNAVINVARTGITLNPILKLAHLVPRGGKCVLDFDYKGLVKILKDNHCIKHIEAIIVYEDETFEESCSPVLAPLHAVKHVKTEEEQKKRVCSGVYSRVLLPDNTVIYTRFMPYWEVQKTEKVSPGSSSKYSPWQTWREEMIKKTKIKRDFKTLISGDANDKVIAALEVEEESTGIQFGAMVSPHAVADEKERQRIKDWIAKSKTVEQLNQVAKDFEDDSEINDLWQEKYMQLTEGGTK